MTSRGATGNSTTLIYTKAGRSGEPNLLAPPIQMASIDNEERLYDDEVSAVKHWWTDSRWRYTRRPYTAEQIVAKRGNLKIDYPSNAQSKKLWKILESRFKVGELPRFNVSIVNIPSD